MKGLLDAYDNQQIIYHVEDGQAYIETLEDAEPLVKLAALIADEPPGKDFRHAAVIPKTVLDRAFIEGWFHDPKAWKKWANDPENRQFRTWGGRL